MRLGMRCLILVGLVVFAPLAAAQESKPDRAVLAIDINFAGLAGLGLDKIPEGVATDSFDAADLKTIRQVERFTLYMSAPESVEALGAAQGDAQPIPFDVFVRIDFKDGKTRQQMVDSMKEGIEEVTVDGKKVFKPTKIGPPNLRLTLIGDKSVEMGTASYVEAKDRQFMSDNLKTTWDAAPKHALRLAADLESAAGLIQSAMAGVGSEIPRPIKPFVELIPKISTVRLTLDGSDDTLLSLAIDGKDEGAAGELFEALEGAFGMAKMAAAEGIDELSKAMPKAGAVAGELVQALNSKKTGKAVTLNIPRPAGLADAIAEAIDASKNTSQKEE